MSSIALHLPQDLTTYLEEESRRRGYRDVSEFVESLIEAERLRNLREELEQSLLQAIDEPSSPLTDQDFVDIEREGIAELNRRRKQ